MFAKDIITNNNKRIPFFVYLSEQEKNYVQKNFFTSTEEHVLSTKSISKKIHRVGNRKVLRNVAVEIIIKFQEGK